MNLYDSVLAFRGTWRKYQARVLNASETYLKDKKIHIVAAPGAGKTTLGIELIRRTGKPCLILSPRIVIRQQWLERIESAFLIDGLAPQAYLSNDIRHPKLITSITYQTLFCGMTQYQGTEEEEDSFYTEEVDFSEFQLLQTVKRAGIQVICLDECHHLKNEWWKALESFMQEMTDCIVISLTATPPYDAAPAQWERYCNMCGPVDEEISVPELVKEGSLCPHQDYVYFNYPSKEEEAMVQAFRQQAETMYLRFMEDAAFTDAIQTHAALQNADLFADSMLEKPSYLSALLIFCQAKKIAFSPKWLRLLQIKKLPAMSVKWMELLLQGFLYEDISNYRCEDALRERWIKELKAHGLLEKKQVSFLVNRILEKTLINSVGKLKSIQTIAHAEFTNMKDSLRMLILTDYIRREQLQMLGDLSQQPNSIGVLPIFELLRRQNCTWRLGVLCGSLILLPETSLNGLEEAAKAAGCYEPLRLKPLYDAQGNSLGYSELEIQGKIHLYAQLVTKLLEQGLIQVLIGTKSLLGEGWDSPCINSLILASFVGSFVLSNQMRGRAIRTMPGNPEKTSNIWHLICLSHKAEQREKKMLGIPDAELSEDYAMLKRRMEGFFGVSYDGTSIENGIERLNIICPPYSPAHIKEINKEMLQRSGERKKLFEQWHNAVFLYEQMETTEECTMNREPLQSGALFFHAIFYIALLLAGEITAALLFLGSGMKTLFALLSVCFTLLLLWIGVTLLKHRSPLKRLKQMGQGVLTALIRIGQITSACRVEADNIQGIFYGIWLTGGTAREKNVFACCMEELLLPVDNQRYLLHSKKGNLTLASYYCVPSLFAKTKDDAVLFQKALEPHIGKYDLIYTRSVQGRAALLKARSKAFANRNQRALERKKKVKGTLE